MESANIRAAFARNITEAFAVLSYMRAVADHGKDEITRSREKLDSSRAILKSTPP